MKRRSAAAALEGKWRRPVKSRPKADNAYGSLVVYGKLLLLWALVLLSDYFVEFRFEYLWPFWLFLRSVYDSFKYQGLAFSVFFICIAVTSDMICYLFIPIHWLFFAASTYVWVQYVWHTEKGVCVQTVCLWLLFVYIEAAIRLREFKAHVDIRHLPFHIDLCRPFAAHCIGYPVVTLGFGFKSYVGYRMRLRRQREVQKTNEYYFEFMREALPPGQVREEAFNPHPSPKSCADDRSADSNATVIGAPLSSSSNGGVGGAASSGVQQLICNGGGSGGGDFSGFSADEIAAAAANAASHVNGDLSNNHHNHDLKGTPRAKVANGGVSSAVGNGGDFEYMEKMSEGAAEEAKGGKKSGAAAKAKGGKPEPGKMSKEEVIGKLEGDLKRLKTDLQQSRNKENDLRDQIISYMSSERHLKSEISNLQVEKSLLESRVSGLLSTRAGEKAALSTLEKKLAEERKQKTDFQIKLETERKSKKEAANAERTAQQNQTRSEVLKLEAEIKTLRVELSTSRERAAAAEQEAYTLRKYRETHGDPEVLVGALKAMKEKNVNIEKALSAETKLKMDLFSALGEARRELGIKQGTLEKKDKEISELKAKIAEVLAVMPQPANLTGSSTAPITPVATTNNSLANFTVPVPTTNTLSLDLPPATDLSFTDKISSTLGGLAEQFGALGGSAADDTAATSAAPGGLYNAFGFGKTNGKINDA